MRSIFTLILAFLILSCDNREKQDSDETNGKKTHIESETFDEFLERFNTDTVFKLTRIRFPIEQAIKDQIEGNDAYMTYDLTSNWLKTLSLEYKDEYHDGRELELKQDTVRTDNEIIIQQRGGYLDSHITRDMDFRFALQDGKWYMVAMKDFSYM